MAGEYPLPVRPSGRKQWNILNGRLPSPLIDSQLDGSPDSLVLRGKKLLDKKCDDEENQEENARLGVYWLIKASEKGNIEATNILEHCLKTGQGISEHNIGDVRTCLTMSQEEKVSRNAARQLFASLSQGEGFITSDQLSEEMLRVQNEGHRGDSGDRSDDRQNHETNWRGRLHTRCKEKLTEDNLVSAASHYAKGELPLVHRVLTLDNTPESSHSHGHRSFLFNPLRIRSSYSRFIDAIGHKPITSFFPFSLASIKTLFVFAVFTLVGLDGIIEALPTILYFATLAVMLISTCQIITKKWEFNHFKKWSNLLVAWGGDGVNPQDAHWAYCTNNIRPYVIFLLSLLVNLTLTPFVSSYSIPHSEIVIISTLCACTTLYTFTWADGKLDSLMLLSFGVNLLARYPYETDAVVSQGWRYLDVHVPTFSSYVVGTGIEFCLNFRVLFYILMPAIFVKMASRERWHGFYTTFVPHCVSLAWWQMAIIASNGATGYGLIRSCLAVVGVVLFLPLAGLASVFLPLAAVVKFLTEKQLFPFSASVGLAFVLLLTVIYIGKKRSTDSRIVTWIQVALCSVSILLLLSPVLNPTPDNVFPRSTPLTWSQYQRHCSLGDTRMKTQSQEKCATLSGLYVHWEGRVLSTTLTRIFNPLALIISKLPVGMQAYISCMYGEKYEDCTNKEECSAPPGLQNRCHLTNWNKYEYEIVISMPSGAWRGEECLATLSAESVFRNFTQALTFDDRIWFSGTLVGNQDGVFDPTRPHIKLYQAGCLACISDKPPPTTVNSITAYSVSDLYTAVKSVLNFLFNPLLIFK